MSQSPDRLREVMRGIVQIVSGRSDSFQQGQLQSRRQARTAQNSFQTEDGHAQAIEHESGPHLATRHAGQEPHSSPPTSIAQRQETTVGATSNQPENYRAECEDIARALRRPTSGNAQSPLRALQQQVLDFFQHGPKRATGMCASILAAAELGRTKTVFPEGDENFSWESCRASATLVGLLACSPARFDEVINFLGYSTGGLDTTTDEIRKTPSACLQIAFQKAKALALAENGTTTVISVSLGDICHFTLGEQEKSRDFASFAHAFVLGIGPEGVVLWQSWGAHGYPLDQWLGHDGAKLQDWEEAGDFVDDFETFAAYKAKVSWIEWCPQS